MSSMLTDVGVGPIVGVKFIVGTTVDTIVGIGMLAIFFLAGCSLALK